MPERDCAHCGSPFIPPSYYPEQKTCCVRCRGLHRAEKAKNVERVWFESCERVLRMSPSESEALGAI